MSSSKACPRNSPNAVRRFKHATAAVGTPPAPKPDFFKYDTAALKHQDAATSGKASMRSIRSTVVAISFLALVLTGCGGGGGGGGGGGPNVAADFALSAGTISFTAVQNGGAPPAQTITVSATGGTFGTDGTVLLSAEVGGAAVHSANITNCSGSTCSLVVVARGDAPPGTYSSQVTVRGCTNFGCAQNVGTPKTLVVTLTVGVGAALTSPSVVTIFAAPNTAPVAQLLLVQSTDAAARWAAS